jgi:hypothetical protein
MNLEMLKIIDFALSQFLKISAYTCASGELYIKVYTKRPVEEVVKEFEEQCFDIIELFDTVRHPKLIENDNEPGVEFLITFSIPKYPPMLICNEPEN